MAVKNNKNAGENTHPAHPIRNIGYLLYTVLNLAAFVALFWFWNANAVLYVIPCAFILGVAAVVGIVNAMRFRKK